MRNFMLVVLSITLFYAGCSEGGNVYKLEMVNGYPVVTGSENDLMWYIDDPANPTTKLNQMTYSKAVEYCKNLDHCDFNDWRVPTIAELRTLVYGYSDIEPDGRCKVGDNCLHKTCLFRGQKSEDDYPCSNKSQDADFSGPGPSGCFFDDVWREYCGKYWSISEVEASAGQVFQIDFVKPSIVIAQKDATSVGFIRCVRNR